jgi:short-subunit dehydrogenase
MDVKGKAVIITGASTGIGQATAELLAERGARLGLIARSEDKLLELASRLNEAWVTTADLSALDAVQSVAARILEHFGSVDVLINNAGQGYDVAVENTDADKFSYMFRLHVLAPLLLMQAVIPGMRAQGAGTIVNISSGTTLLTLPNNGPYTATKLALNGLTLTARKELARDNIKVSLVYPSLTDTPFEDGTQAFSDQATLWKPAPGGPGAGAAPGGAGPGARPGAGVPAGGAPGAGAPEAPPPDPPVLVARKVLEAIETGEAEVFAHERMAQLRGQTTRS